MVLSTLAVAVHSTQCQVPFFVQIMERPKNMFLGIFAGAGIRADFQMVVLSKKPPQCGHLSGLLSMFKGKISAGSVVDMPSVRVTARFFLKFAGAGMRTRVFSLISLMAVL